MPKSKATFLVINAERDKRRTELICKMIIGLLKLTQSGLSKWSKALPGEKDLEAKYKQLQRFARYFRFSPRLYSKVVWQLYGQGKQVYLTLDRSEWKMRGKWVQVTMIGIAGPEDKPRLGLTKA